MDSKELKKYHDGDHAFFNGLIKKLQQPIYYFLYRYVGNATDAEELTQETFVKAYIDRVRFRGDAKLSTWIYTIAANLAKNHLRWRSLHKFLPVDSLLYTIPDNIHDEPEINTKEKSLLKFIQALPRRQRSVFILKYFNQLSHQEISDILGISVSSSKTNFHYAVNSLKSMVNQEAK